MSIKNILIILKTNFISFLFCYSLFSYGKIIKICADENEQIPYIIISEGSLKGIEIEIIDEALKDPILKEKYKYEIDVMPWARCLDSAKKGIYDGTINASYTEERAEFLNYPPQSGKNEKKPCSSDYKLYCGGYLVITQRNEKYEFDGNKKNLPIPVRVSRGYSVFKELEEIYKENLDIGKSDIVNVQKMLRDKIGSVVAYIAFQNKINKIKNVKNKVKVNEVPYVMKSYFIPFSKESKIPKQDIDKIWENIKKINQNENKMKKMYEKYSKYI
ncbi:hypothetical protein QEJ31_09565 [Pigmentibacter sp. JX0631]|uniref:transporter substrate-binding domain-containing protein n=1 Tax=Pigmentibacter sp. JX0631 TaxID=2976982 RepID=UPI002468699C|nr:transporter substrate-binding domain-containing protein [Pigmentibacter sp. JX0631]WGL58772.1 hypothetical protein QEJ31_09565 [Pigmentibacter sp. JX0631]